MNEPAKAEENILGEPITPQEPSAEGEPVEKPGDAPAEKKPEEEPAEETVDTLKSKLADLEKAKAELEKLHGDKDKNIRSMGDKIRELEKARREAEEGKSSNLLFKEIRRTASMTKEERDKLSDTEAALIDQIAALQDGMNRIAEKYEQGEEAKSAIDPAAIVREEAKSLSGGKRAVANQIIEAFNVLKFNLEGLSEEEISDRVKIAAGNVPDYKPPQEQPNGKGTAVKVTKSDTTVDTSKEREAQKKNLSGGYEL